MDLQNSVICNDFYSTIKTGHFSGINSSYDLFNNLGSCKDSQFQFSFRRVSRQKTSSVIKVGFSEMLSAKNLCLTRCKIQHVQTTNRGETADLTLLQTLLAISQKSREPDFWKKNRLFCFIIISKFSSFNNPSAIITFLSELHFNTKDFFHW